MKYFNLVYPLIYLISILFGISNYSKIKENIYLKMFLGFVIYSLFTEIGGYYISFVLGKRSYYIYNIWTLANTYFYLFFILVLLRDTFKKRILQTLIFIYTIFSIVDILFYSDFIGSSLNINIIVGSFLIVFAVLFFFTELLKSDLILDLKHSMVSWIMFGVLFFNIGTIPIYIIAELIHYQGVFDYITLGLNIIMAGCFITGFIVSKKEFNT